MLIRINHLIDPTRPIQAIKQVRAVTGLGLKDSKEIIDAVRGKRYGADVAPRAQEITVADGTDLSEFGLWINYSVVGDEPASGVPRDTCFAFLLDVLANASPGDAATLRTKASYLAFVEAIR